MNWTSARRGDSRKLSRGVGGSQAFVLRDHGHGDFDLRKGVAFVRSAIMSCFSRAELFADEYVDSFFKLGSSLR